MVHGSPHYLKWSQKKNEDRRVSKFQCGNQHYTNDMKRGFSGYIHIIKRFEIEQKGITQGVSNQIFIEMVNMSYLLDFKPRLNQISRFCQEEQTISCKKANQPLILQCSQDQVNGGDLDLSKPSRQVDTKLVHHTQKHPCHWAWQCCAWAVAAPLW